MRQQDVYLTDEETRALKIQAAHERRSMSAIVSDALRAYLAAYPMVRARRGERPFVRRLGG